MSSLKDSAVLDSPKSLTRNSDRNESQTVLRACEVLRVLAPHGEQLPSSEVIRRTRLPKTTVLRLLRTLVRGGMLERSSSGVYSSVASGVSRRGFRIGFAGRDDSEFARTVLQHLERAATREHMHLVTVGNGSSAREALRIADYLIKQGVDLVLQFQAFERVVPQVSSRFKEARLPVIAIDIPHPDAIYFGANNFRAGMIGGKALGRWASEYWRAGADQLLLLDLSLAGPTMELRMRGFTTGLQLEFPSIANASLTRVNGRGDFEEVYDLVRHFLRRAPMRRTLVGAVNDTCALATLRAFEDAGASEYCAITGQNAVLEARNELRRPGSRMVGTVAYFPERYGDEVLALARMMLEGRQVPSEVFINHQLISARNVNLLYPLDRPGSADFPRSQPPSTASTVANGVSGSSSAKD